MLNSLIADLGRSIDIDEEEGLKSFTIDGFSLRSGVDFAEWPLEQIALKCHRLQALKLNDLGKADENKSQLLVFAA